ncbi:hypothetical protein PUNSTDRAFT_73339 [Punctularia strigosozonata HHB-11173 SS5]|uniref:uncharacterized protein n=1 Tax=Punctularia strigosozonata (strain HHB-11173) TaxID=741275 RepID=UPI0004417647|nr:uncharacterized protein PUNSTDRAFT_73339 [Punctularia strigosozonata HHB-11173 SS5]EIN06311.1 hypothetical protein PUNSTDRAFT_73339 [Punctularia strigosozonata HHB-11173 SS5]
MHLGTLNLTALLLELFRGTIQCAATDDRAKWDWAMLVGDAWEAHGSLVAGAHPYLPGCYDRAPRNPAEKINSGYKSWEYLIYVFVLGPAVFRPWVPAKYWTHFCKLVAVMRRFFQRKISRLQLLQARRLVLEYVVEFELLYCRRRADRIHFVRPVVHGLIHLPEQVTLKGPLPGHSQYVMERTIGNLGEEIKQDSRAYANLSERALYRCQANTMKAILPELAPDSYCLPRGAIDLGNGYILLRALDHTARSITSSEERALQIFIDERTAGSGISDCRGIRVHRWARLRLPCGQTARSLWKEGKKPLSDVRMSRNVKVYLDGCFRYGEVQYYIMMKSGGETIGLAMISLLSPPDAELLTRSHGTLYACTHGGQDSLIVTCVKSIRSVVAVIPMMELLGEECEVQRFFVAEKPGMEWDLMSDQIEALTAV